ncbi:MAG: DUF362 domain-containing protein [Deltaproteobacteria bacterium]|nr:DUF362 domain-containing protein [Deltaproteobacteria bacterium]
MSDNDTTRREFLRQACAAAAGAGALSLLPGVAACADAAEKSRSGQALVAVRTNPKVFTDTGLDPVRVRELVERSVAAVVGVRDPKEAFRALFKPDDVVAIKVNCLAGPEMSSSPAVVAALVAGLNAIGVENRRIVIWERTTTELMRAGFAPNSNDASRPLCYGNDEGGFGRELSFSGDVGSMWTNVLGSRATALINVPVLKDHDLAGVGCAMKNMYGAIHNPNRYHDNNCDPYVAQVSAHPFVRGKLRLVLVDALTAQYHGGPARVVSNQWRPAAIIASRDPVAVDRLAYDIIDKERASHGLASLAESKRPPRWLDTAGRMGLGESRLEHIRIDRA